MITKTLSRKGLTLALAGAVAAAAFAAFAFSPAAEAGHPGGIVCTTGPANPTFALTADDGFASFPDGNSIYMWGFTATGDYQYPGPNLCVNEGDTVTIVLTNNLPEPVSIMFPGQTLDSSIGDGGTSTLGVDQAGVGGVATYVFSADNPGTYLFQSGTAPEKQTQMGLFGAIVVRPAMGASFAYNDAATEFDPHFEHLLVLHEVDSALHYAVQTSTDYVWSEVHHRYWTINGRSFPDTINDNFVAWMPAQPYGAMVITEALAPGDVVSKPGLVRYLNAGSENHPFHPHGNDQQMIAQDGAPVDNVKLSFTKTVGAGQTFDLLIDWRDADAFIVGDNPASVDLASILDLTFKDDASFYSGSPYIGVAPGTDDASLPYGVTTFNQCGEFYFPWHSHALNEVQNFNEGFGGMLTLWRVNPPSTPSCVGGTP